MAIVVVYEDSDGSFEMLAIQDKQPVETFVSDGSHETLGDGIPNSYSVTRCTPCTHTYRHVLSTVHCHGRE